MAASVGRVGKLFKLQKYIVALLFVSFICGMILGIILVTDSDFPAGLFGTSRSEKSKEQIRRSASNQGKARQQEGVYKQQIHGIILDKIKAKHDSMVIKKENHSSNLVNKKENHGSNVLTYLPRVRNPKTNLTVFGDKKKNRLKVS